MGAFQVPMGSQLPWLVGVGQQSLVEKTHPAWSHQHSRRPRHLAPPKVPPANATYARRFDDALRQLLDYPRGHEHWRLEVPAPEPLPTMLGTKSDTALEDRGMGAATSDAMSDDVEWTAELISTQLVEALQRQAALCKELHALLSYHSRKASSFLTHTCEGKIA